ncbi:MAG: Histidine kinase, gyrase and HSP90-like ATPase [Actinomycetia bacterium]|nr:Histidine kinase, gyrase and HSP90-like ATPase [Actinomycetes bacterium]
MAREGNDSSGRWTVARQVGQFALAGLIATGIVGLATAVASRRLGEREAISDARTVTLVRAQNTVEPVLTDGLATGDPDAVAAVGHVVRTSVLDPNLVRVKIWTRDGTIVYSDEARLIGTHFGLDAPERAAMDAGRMEADVSDLSKPENRFERKQGKLLEVYLPIRTPTNQRLLFEAYFKYSAVSASGNRIWRSFAPITIGALVVLELIQITLAWSLARRLRQRQVEREALLRGAIEASDAERRRIAGDLHDGVVQDLAGVAYSIAGTARDPGLPASSAIGLERSASEVRDSIKSLRSLLVEIYPPNLEEAGLESALGDLLARADARGVPATLDADRLTQALPVAAAGLLYRAAQEALRNVLAHAQARSVTVRVATEGDLATLDVVDDGIGFDTEIGAARFEGGHLGLRGLADLVRDAGGTVTVTSEPGEGTTLHVEVPLR